MENILRQTENKWLDDLFGYIRELFLEFPLPSHDHEHHLRVWRYAIQLIEQLEHAGKKITHGDAEDLIFAVFFHDTGLTRINGPEHGKASRELCGEYLRSQGKRVHDMDRVLEAIENHDDKTYPDGSGLYDAEGLNIHTTLAVCDDLDAFGKMGIFRYAAIYLSRGIPMEDLGLKIMANLSGRFSNFIYTCSFLPEMIRIHVPRHNLTEDFYRNYNLQLRLIGKGSSRPGTGPAGVVREIFRQTMAGVPTLPEICDNVIAENEDLYVLQFFHELKNEL